MDIAKFTTNHLICEKINDYDLRDRCYGIVAIAAKNSSLCSWIQDEYQSYVCNYLVSKVSRERNYSNICENVPTRFYRDECNQWLALMVSNKSI